MFSTKIPNFLSSSLFSAHTTIGGRGDRCFPPSAKRVGSMALSQRRAYGPSARPSRLVVLFASHLTPQRIRRSRTLPQILEKWCALFSTTYALPPHSIFSMSCVFRRLRIPGGRGWVVPCVSGQKCGLCPTICGSSPKRQPPGISAVLPRKQSDSECNSNKFCFSGIAP